MSGVTGCSGTPLPLLSSAEVSIKRRKTRKKKKKRGKGERPVARGTPRQ